MRLIIQATIIFLIIENKLSARSPQENFKHKVMEVVGDLNKDNLPDKVIVLEDIRGKDKYYQLKIFFKKPTGKFQLVVESTKIIDPQIPSNHDGYMFECVTIKKGILTIKCSLLRGHYEHKFRYQMATSS